MKNPLFLVLAAGITTGAWGSNFQDVGFLGLGYQSLDSSWSWKGSEQGSGTFGQAPTVHGWAYVEGGYIDADWDVAALFRQGGGDPWTIREDSLFGYFPRVAFGVFTSELAPVGLGLGADFATFQLARYVTADKKFDERVSSNDLGRQGVAAAPLVRSRDCQSDQLFPGLGWSYHRLPGNWDASAAPSLVEATVRSLRLGLTVLFPDD